MKRVIFPYAENGQGLVQYPDNIALFANTKQIGTNIVADYSGEMALTAYVDVVAAPVWAWYIDIGALFDRFGAAKLAVLTSTEPIVKAFVTDFMSRHWGDLQSPQIVAGIEYMRGVTVPGIGTIGTPIAGVTAELETAILTTPVALSENLVTRKLYFS
jgi:hypothetical protein